MVIGRNLWLPRGYSALELDGLWHLFDSRAALLLSSPDATEVEIHAWRDLWRKRHEEFAEELAALYRAGRPMPAFFGQSNTCSASGTAAKAQLDRQKRDRIKP